MRRFTILLVLMALIGANARPAFAIIQFQKEFLKLYIEEHKDAEFQEYVTKKVKCYLCHQGRKKTNHNAYGIHLVELLDRKKDAKDKKKIVEVIEKVGKMHSDPKDKKSPTYAELIAKSQLPGGKLEDLKKEPPKKDKEEKEGAKDQDAKDEDAKDEDAKDDEA